MRAGEGAVMRDIERRAGQQFREVGLASVAEAEPFAADVYDTYATEGRGLVAEIGEVAIGYLVLDVVDGNAHVEQVSVVPEHQRQGVGRALIDRTLEWAVHRGLNAMTLTTFKHVPWNAPYYGRLGFREMSEDSIGPELMALRRAEGEQLGPEPRVCMRRVLPFGTSCQVG